ILLKLYMPAFAAFPLLKLPHETRYTPSAHLSTEPMYLPRYWFHVCCLKFVRIFASVSMLNSRMRDEPEALLLYIVHKPLALTHASWLSYHCCCAFVFIRVGTSHLECVLLPPIFQSMSPIVPVCCEAFQVRSMTSIWLACLLFKHKFPSLSKHIVLLCR